VVHALEEGGPAEVLGEDLGERALPRADVAGDGDVGLGAPALGVGVGGGDGERGLHGRRPGCAAKIARGAPASATGPGAPALFTPASVIVPRRAEPRTTAPVLSSGAGRRASATLNTPPGRRGARRRTAATRPRSRRRRPTGRTCCPRRAS